MAANTSPIFGLTPNLAEVTFVNADGTTAKDLVSAGADGTKVSAVSVTSDDTTDPVLMQLYVHDGTTAYLVGTVPVATLSGTDGVATAVEMLDVTYLPWLDHDSEFVIPTGYKLQVGPVAAVTAAKTVTVVCFGVDY